VGVRREQPVHTQTMWVKEAAWHIP
jgi:hypothetical protein